MDIIKYDKNEVYNIPLTINIPENYSDNDVKSALDVMFDVHPILKSVIGIADEVPCLKTGNDPNITYLNEYDEDRISGFITSPFDLNTALSRFLLVKNDNDAGSLLVGVFHHLIFDGFSTSVFKKHLFELLKGNELELDNGFIKSRVYDEEIAKTLKYDEAEAFYESMLSEVDDVYSLLSDVGDNQAGFYSLDLTAEKSDIRSFLKSCNITENILFISAFSYTLSRFTGDSKVLFNILDNGRD
ncbi:MAG: condensation domain-containing protein, partial [Methanobrevibacter sp.]|nr:condensation domain-containing protein [Methanobrevibacter sp.]